MNRETTGMYFIAKGKHFALCMKLIWEAMVVYNEKYGEQNPSLCFPATSLSSGVSKRTSQNCGQHNIA